MLSVLYSLDNIKELLSFEGLLDIYSRQGPPQTFPIAKSTAERSKSVLNPFSCNVYHLCVGESFPVTPVFQQIGLLARQISSRVTSGYGDS
ncbi:hypothetical protein NPIL_300401 [Nephila pilipes]|uniref:Uncharacterized protein n=1 Tax=Nephila pilipes TaxID=299642 RepID=A0A8X6JZU9_NEPPI|nr:hypothetical protein NPIL_300401 [Nephila pilipes]